MKAELLLDMKGPNPEFDRQKFFELSARGLPYPVKGKIDKPKETIIDDKDCFWLVKFGCAKPADDECLAACPDWSEEQAVKNLELYKKTAAGKLTGDKKYDAD